MGSTMVRYKVRSEQADENVALVEAVYEELARNQPAGIHYATFRLPDGVTFMHVVFESDDAAGVLGQMPAFQAFTADIAGRCEEPPTPTELTLVGSYAVGS